MSELVIGKEVRVDARKNDRYGRTIGRVWVPVKERPTNVLGRKRETALDRMCRANLHDAA